MLIIKKAKDLKSNITSLRKKNKKIGFVPTMGALHQGHISLIDKASEENDIVVCSIFVNPSQFNQKEDFDKYPITTSSDIDKLIKSPCDILYLPSLDEIYPDGWNSEAKLDLGKLATIWEGEFRPGHFDGVVQVVGILLEMVLPNNLYLGQKDFQQCAIIKKLISINKYPINTIICETKREASGLAMSSRNARLKDTDIADALILSKSLFFIKNNFEKLNNEELISQAKSMYANNDNIKLEYLAIVDRDSLESLTTEKNNAVVLVVAWVGGVRLIDNVLLS
jgi:pantoate--beta-alanine ligase